jgi:hypothetical protein
LCAVRTSSDTPPQVLRAHKPDLYRQQAQIARDAHHGKLTGVPIG